MNKLSNSQRVHIIRALVEGNSVSSTVRMTGISKPTILKLIVEFGDVCQTFHDEQVKGLSSRRIQMDEIWAFVGAKEANTTREKKIGLKWGDNWTWTAIDADTKLMVSWHIGGRHAGSANEIMGDVAWRLTHKIQLTTDGLHAYWDAANYAFNGDVDYAQLIKIYGIDRSTETRYSPPKCVGIEIKSRMGNPDPAHVSTSFIERSNLTVRMGMRRYTRLTNGHSKKFENHVAMTAIFWTHYNFCRIHQTLRVTPAMEAGLTKRILEIDDLVALMK
jgi:IS1 family transposase